MEYEVALQRIVVGESDEQRDQDHRSRVVEAEPVGDRIYAGGVEREASARNERVFDGLAAQATVSRVEGPMTVQEEVGERARGRPESSRDDVPDVEELDEAEDH